MPFPGDAGKALERNRRVVAKMGVE